MNHPQNVAETVSKLFGSRWLCKIQREYLAMIREVPTYIDTDATPHVQAGYDQFGGVTRTESCGNMAGIIDMLYNVPRVTQDEQDDPSLITIEESYLSTAQIAELISKGASLFLVNTMDSVAIYETIGIYLNQVEYNRQWDLHYKEPPKEDLDAFERLRDMLSDVARPLRDRGQGDSGFAALMRIINPTAVGLIQGDKPVGVALSGVNNKVEVTNMFGGVEKPFQFRAGFY